MKNPTINVQGRVHSPFEFSLQSGFSLIELMVAMVISLLIMGAVLTLFLDVSRTNDEMAKTNVQIENGRFAMQLIANDVKHGGYWGGYVPHFADMSAVDLDPDYPLGFVTPTPCASLAGWSASDKDNLLRFPVQTYDAVPAGCSTQLASQQPGTDILVVRHADTCNDGDVGCAADTVYFQFSRCVTELETAPYGYVLGTAGFTKTIKDCLTPAAKRRYISNIYYIRSYSVAADDGIPTLMRAEFKNGVMQAAQPLIEGVEGFTVELGIDNETGNVNYAADPTATNRGDGAADGIFIRCTLASPCSVDELINVVVVKLHVLARSLTTTPGYTDNKTYTLGSTSLGPFNDGFKRHAYSTAVSLINISSRRESL